MNINRFQNCSIIGRHGLKPSAHRTRWVVMVCALSVLAAGSADAFQRAKRTRDGLSPTPRTIKKKGAAGTSTTPPIEVQPNAEGSTPTIKVDEVTHNFGAVWVGPRLNHAFTITNEGTAPLEITRVKPSCGCTIAGTYPRTIKPGESGKFPFSIDSKKLRNKFRKAITISSNDPVTPELRLQLAGECKRYVDISPPSAHFSRITDSKPRERLVNITNNTDQPLELKLKPLAKDSKYTCELKEVEAGKKYALTVRIAPPYSPGTWRETITLETNVAKQATVTVNATALIPERLEVQPAELRVYKRPGQEKHTVTKRQLRFRNHGEKPVKVVSATANDAKLKLNIKEQTAGKAYTIDVEWPDDYEAPPSGAIITLKTDDPSKPVLTVPLRGRSRTTATAGKLRPLRGAELLVGQPAPSFELKTTAGKELSNSSMNKNITVLDFFAVNCPYCKKQLPRLESVRKEFEKKGVRFVAVSQTMRGKRYPDDQVVGTLQGLKVNTELAIDGDNAVGPLFKATSYPTMVVVGKSGKVEAVNLGNIADLETRLRNQLNTLIGGKRLPATLQTAARTTAKKNTPRKRPAEEMVGKPAPNFVLTMDSGKTVSKADLAGSVTVLDFFAANCPFCKKQMPRVEPLRKQYEKKGVKFINVAQTMHGKRFPADAIKKILAGVNVSAPLAIDVDNQVGPLFKATSYPTMVILGKTGKVEAVNIGNIGDLETRMKSQLNALLAGKSVPQVAAAKAKPAQARKRPVEQLVGKPAPDFALTTTTGKAVSKANLAGSVAVLDFFATNCPFCKKQMPRIEPIRKKYESKGVRFINVAQTMHGKKFTEDQTKGVLAGLNVKAELAIDADNRVGPLFKATSYPTMIVLGKDGKVAAVNVGNIAGLEKRLTGQLDALLSGKSVPSFASAAPKKRRERPAAQMAGRTAPSFEIKTLEGKSVSNEDFSNHPATVLNFVAPNCHFCKRQLPQVEKIRAEYADKGVRFVNVTQTMRQKFSNDEVVAVFNKVGSKFEIAPDAGNAVGRLFKATSYPTMVVVDRNGKVAHVNIGASRDIDTKLKGQLDKLISNKSSSARPIGADLDKKGQPRAVKFGGGR